MAYAFSVSSNIAICTQSGTDTTYTGIATAITNQATVARSTAYVVGALVKPPTPTGFWYRCAVAGTTAATAPVYNAVDGGATSDGTAGFIALLAPIVRTLGTQNHYYMPAFRMAINGSLTIANPQIENFTCWDTIQYGAASIFRSGTFASDGVTPLYDAVHFTATRVSANNSDNGGGSFQLQNGAQCTLIGGEVQVAGAIGLAAGTTLRTYNTRWRGTKQWGGVSSTRIRAYSTTSIFRNCEFYDIAYDLFQMPAEFSVKARKCEYVAQYVGSVAGGVDAYFKASALENVDGVYDFDNYGNGYVELFNCAKGANLNVVTQLNATMCTPLYQDLQITAKDTTGVAVQDVRFTCTDVPNNSPTQTFTTRGGLKVWDFQNPLSYQTTTNASGIALSSPVLQVWYYSSGLKKNLRFPLSTATYEGRAYNYKTMTTSVVLGSNTIQDVSAGMVGLDTATTVTETVAGAITGISLVPSGSTGGVITVSSNHTLQDIWNYYRYWISQFANKTSNDTWTCSNGKLNTALWTLTVNSGVTITPTTAISILQSQTITNNGTITSTYIDSVGSHARLLVSGLSTGMVIKLINGSSVLASSISIGSSVSLEYFIANGTTTIPTTLYVEKATGQANGYNLYTNSLVLDSAGASTTAIMSIDTFYGRSSGQADRANISVTWNSTTGAPTITLSGDADIKSIYDVVVESHATIANITYNRPTTADGFTYQFTNAIFTGTGKMTGTKQFYTTGAVSILYDLILNNLNTINFLPNSWIKVIKTLDNSVITTYGLNTIGQLELNLPNGTDYKVFLKKDGYKPFVTSLNSGTGQIVQVNQPAQDYYNSATDISTITPLIDVTNASGILTIVSVGEMKLTSAQVCAVIDYLQKDEDYGDVALYADTGDIWKIDSQYQSTPNPTYIKIARQTSLTSSQLTIWDTYFTTENPYPDTDITPLQTSTGLWVMSNASAFGEVVIRNEQAVAIAENAAEKVWNKELLNGKIANLNVSQNNNFSAITSVEVQKTN